MHFSNIPVRNPGRYFEQFVKVVQPKGPGCNTNVPNMGITGTSGSPAWNGSGIAVSNSGSSENQSGANNGSGGWSGASVTSWSSSTN